LLYADGNALGAQTKVEGVLEITLIIGAGIKDNGQRLGGVNSGGGCVKG
jgi:hypothetical protein